MRTREQIRAYWRSWYVKNKEKMQERDRQRRAYKRERWNEWEKRNPEKVKAKRLRRAKAERQSTPKWVDKKELNKIYAGCPKGYQVDHIIPLLGDNVSGLTVPWNLQYLPKHENAKKGNKIAA